MFNEEQTQAEALETLKDLKRTVEMAINVVELGPMFPCKPEDVAPVDLEENGTLIGDWYCTRVKKR